MTSKEKTEEREGRVLKRKGGRRAFLAGAAGAAVGATTATLLPQGTKRAEAAPGDPLILGQPNDGGTQRTSLTATLKSSVGGPPSPDSTFFLENAATSLGPDERARALLAHSASEAIFGVTFGDPVEGGAPTGVRGHSHLLGGGYGPAPGVSGGSGSGPGVEGLSESGPGVDGQSDGGPGVRGHSQSWAGVVGRSRESHGVAGVTQVEPPPDPLSSSPVAGVTGASFKPDVEPSPTPSPDDFGNAIGVLGTSGGASGVHGESGSGPGVEGHSQSGTGVQGRSEGTFGVAGQSEGAPGVMGHSRGSHGVAGVTQVELPPHPLPSTFIAGVTGASFKPDVEPSPLPNPEDFGDVVGVLGLSGGAAGVQGISRTGWGVLGVAAADAPAVCAMSASLFDAPFPVFDGGVALAVSGKAVFSTAGSGVVPARTDAVVVPNPAVTPDSHVTVTFTADPGRASVAWVERQPGTGFVAHLLGRPRTDVPFTYLIVEPNPPVMP